MTKLDDFTRAYIEAALWSSTLEPDQNYGIDDLAPETLARMIADCKRFQRENIEHIAWDNLKYFPHRYSTHEKAGHDFWLTRNGHGCGFWDGNWNEPAASILDKASKRFSQVDLYVGDDGKVYACA